MVSQELYARDDILSQLLNSRPSRVKTQREGERERERGRERVQKARVGPKAWNVTSGKLSAEPNFLTEQRLGITVVSFHAWSPREEMTLLAILTRSLAKHVLFRGCMTSQQHA